MRTHELIEKASLGPTALRVIYQAFDDGWSEIAANYSEDETEAARTRLALALLSVANDERSDSRTLKRMALEMIGKRETPLERTTPTIGDCRGQRTVGGAKDWWPIR